MNAMVDLDDYDIPQKRDFRRANGAPMVMIDGKNVRMSRPSSWGKILDDENALVNWKIDRACEGVAKDPALQARFSAVKPDDRAAFKELREIAINAGRGDQAADIGTALHAMSERWEDPADDFDPPEQYAKSLRVYSATLEQYGLVSDMFEYAVVSRKWGAAGTADRLYKTTIPLMTPDGEIHPPGTLFVGDLKTGKKLDFSLPGYCVQMAIYADGELYDVVNDEFLETPPINRNWGILVHLPAGETYCQLIWCDLGVGEHGARLVQEVKEWRRAWKNVGPYGAYEAAPPMTPAAVADMLDAVPLEGTELGVALVEFAQARIAAIRAHDPKAVKRLMTLWPEGVPTPKKGLSDPDDVERVLNVLDKVEAEFSVTFPSGDPRSQPGVYKDDLNRSNNPNKEKTTT
jgi:hypothetical protein